MKKYLTNGMHMNEQIDRNTGELKSAQAWKSRDWGQFDQVAAGDP